MAKNIPVRMCTGCSARKPKNELIRVVKTPEGEIVVDTTGKLNGRGAYICKSEECFLKAAKSKRLENAFGVSVDDTTYEKIKGEIKSIEQ